MRLKCLSLSRLVSMMPPTSGEAAAKKSGGFFGKVNVCWFVAALNAAMLPGGRLEAVQKRLPVEREQFAGCFNG